MTNTHGKSIFISGGAAGIGRQVALRFLSAGWTVGAYDIDDAALASLKEEYPEIITGRLDVTDADQWEEALADFTSHTGGTLDVLDNKAGIIGDGDIVNQSTGIIAKQIEVNCTGVVLGARAAHKYLKRTKNAHMVTMGSASGIYGQPHIAPYSASKFFVLGFTQAMDLEWRKDDIRVVSLMPLWAKTKLAAVEAKSTKRLGVNIRPEDVAAAVWKAVHPANFIERQRHMYSVSTADLILRYLGRLGPAPISRFVNGVIAG
ncbi:SDR family oxidoreductase [Corynebacterium bovis]|uniref:SDR family oxidoreductase n=1 Tax=Corynebacterium bovis TaxID=36808 RepID=UPI00264BE19B|nr:SDR family oxidoreductase [Corynebacterium bovis]MDN8578414.1 SDR family oxidoreductase [Corynebacterium bovis]